MAAGGYVQRLGAVLSVMPSGSYHIYSPQAGSTHPTGMLSCVTEFRHKLKVMNAERNMKIDVAFAFITNGFEMLIFLKINLEAWI